MLLRELWLYDDCWVLSVVRCKGYPCYDPCSPGCGWLVGCLYYYLPYDSTGYTVMAWWICSCTCVLYVCGSIDDWLFIYLPVCSTTHAISDTCTLIIFTKSLQSWGSGLGLGLSRIARLPLCLSTCLWIELCHQREINWCITFHIYSSSSTSDKNLLIRKNLIPFWRENHGPITLL